jgi:signal transduction histidine kinase
MRLWPDSLFGRLMLAVSVPIAIAAAISLVLVARDRLELARRVGGTSEALQQVATTARMLDGLPAAERAAEIARLDRRPGEWREPGRMPRPAVDPPQRVARTAAPLLGEPLRRLLGAGYAVEVEAARAVPLEPLIDWGLPGNGAPMGPGQGAPRDAGARHPDDRPRGRGLYDLRVVTPAGAVVTFRIPGPPRAAPFESGFAWQLALLAAALALVLYLATRRLTRPLTALQRAAESVGRSTTRTPIPEAGAREIRDTIRAFNTIQDRLHRYLDGRTRVLAAMSHDLRTPLTRLRLRAEAIDDESVRGKFAADIEEMDALVDGALALFRGLDARESSEPVDIDALLSLLRSDFRERGHELEIAGGARAPVFAKPIGLKRALSNLIDNAIKYGGGAELRVEDDGRTVRIRVLDRGPGIPEAELEAVFEPFHRIESSRNRELGGTGLGLCSARDAIEMQGGTLRLRNRTDRAGLEATIELPRP